MNYGASPMSVLNLLGGLLVIVGMVVSFAAVFIANKWFIEYDNAKIYIKAVGCVMIILGALLLLDFMV